LARHLPPSIQLFFYGKELFPHERAAGSTDPTENEAASCLMSALNTTRNMKNNGGKQGDVAEVLVYAVVSNIPAYRRIVSMLQAVPLLRIRRLKSADFFPLAGEDAATLPYPTFGIDRAAGLYFLERLTRDEEDADIGLPPVLLFDVGTAMTYSGIDTTGKIRPGGITLGVQAKFQVLSMLSRNFYPPQVNREIERRMQRIDAGEVGSISLLSSTSREEELIAGIVHETVCFAREVVSSFVQEMSKDDDETVVTAGTKQGQGLSRPKVYITGGDGLLLTNLLIREGNISQNMVNEIANQKKNNKNHPTHGESDTPYLEIDPRIRKHLFAAKAGTKPVEITFNRNVVEQGVIRMLVDRVNGEFPLRRRGSRARAPEAASRSSPGPPGVAAPPKASSVAAGMAPAARKSVGPPVAATRTSHASSEPGKGSQTKSSKRDSSVGASGRDKKPRAEPAPAERPSMPVGPVDANDLVTPIQVAKNPEKCVHRRLAKYFGPTLFYGTVHSFSPPEANKERKFLFRIHYDDGDKEDIFAKELTECFQLYSETYLQEKGGDPSIKKKKKQK
jgi:pantothenate kinase type III